MFNDYSSQTLTDPSSAQAEEQAQLVETCESGARWFYWVAALSLITSIISLMGSEWGFIISLGATQVIDGIALAAAENMGNASKVIAFVLDAVVAGVFVLLGLMAVKRQTWAFIVGMILFALDGIIFVIAQDWIGIAFHVFVLYMIFTGYRACAKLAAMPLEADLHSQPDLHSQAETSEGTSR